MEREEERAPLAALAFATTEGLVLLDAVGAGIMAPLAVQGLSML